MLAATPNTAAMAQQEAKHDDTAAAAMKTLSLADAPRAASSASDVVEPLLVENNKRYVLFPIEYNDIWRSYKHIQLKFWTADDMEVDEDAIGFNKLSGKERTFLTHAVAMLAAGYPYLSDENIDARLSDEIQLPEARCFFGFETMQRNMHLELFNKFLDAFVDSPEENQLVFDALLNFKAVASRRAWVRQYLTESEEPYASRITALAVFNAIFQQSLIIVLMHSAGVDARTAFSTRFEFILPALIRSLAKLQIDLHLYRKFATMIATKHMKKRASETYVHKMVSDLIDSEFDMLREILELASSDLVLANTPVDIQAVKDSIAAKANECLVDLGFKPLYPSAQKSNKLSWIDEKLHVEMAKEDPEVFRAQISQQRTPSQKKESKIETPFTVDEDF